MRSKIALMAALFLCWAISSNAPATETSLLDQSHKFSGLDRVKVTLKKDQIHISVDGPAFGKFSFSEREPSVFSKLFGGVNTPVIELGSAQITECQIESHNNMVHKFQTVLSQLKNYQSTTGRTGVTTADMMDAQLTLAADSNGDLCLHSVAFNIPVSPDQLKFSDQMTSGKIDLGNSNLRFEKVRYYYSGYKNADEYQTQPSAAVVARNSLIIQPYCDATWKYNIALLVEPNDGTGSVHEMMIVLLNDPIGGCWSAE
jgi:hypothetical protein